MLRLLCRLAGFRKELADDSGQEERSLIKQCDVNGNPLPPVSREQYLRLRQSSSTPHRASKEGGFSTNADSDPATPKGESHGIGNKSEDPKNSSSILANRSSDKRKRKRNGGQAKPDEVAQNCPDYVGYLDVEFLVHYVNNGVSKKNLKLKKSGNPPAVGIDQGTMSTAVNDASHRSRASSKQLLTTGVGENSEDGLTPASEIAQLVRSEYLNINNHCSPQGASNHSLTEDQETGGSQVAAEESAEMGNSSASEQQKSVEMVPPKTLKPVKTYVSDTDTDLNAENGKVESPLTPNHIPPTAKPNKKAPSSGEGKDKSKVKNGGSTNNHKKDSVQNNDINQVNKKSRGKVPKSNIMAGNVQAPSTVVEKEKKMNGGVNATLPDDCDRTPLTVSPDLPVFQDSMIYTDRMFSNGLVTSAQEEEFTMVSKKKKKRTVQSRTSNFHAQTSSRSHSHKDFDLSFPSSQISSGNSYNPNRRWDSSYKPRVNPPPPPPDSPTEFSKVERKEEEEEQDLSQSAFPALNRTDRSFQFLGPEARSLEDLACGVGQHSFDKDSDQASSKSLPAVQHSGTRISYAVSYASMASAKTPRQSVDSSKATSMSSSTYDSNCEESAVAPTAAMKWKGSPQERRHSIGSAPEDLSKTVGSPSLQRTGSQEMLPRDSPEKSGRGLASPVTVLASGSDSIDSTCTVVGMGADQENVHHAPVCPSSIPVSETGAPPQAVAPGSAAHSIPAQSVPGPLAPSGSLSVSSVISNPSANPLTSNPSKSRGAQPASSSRSQFAPGAAQNKANLTKPVNNENKRKCVIFCNDSPEANRDCSYRFGDLPESWIYEQFLMPSKSESASAPTCASEDSSATSGCVSPTRGLVTDTAAANPCGVSHASSNSTVSSDVPLLTSPQMPSGGKDTPSSSHSQTPLPIKASPGSASLKDQSAAGDSKAREGRVNVTNKADVGVSVRPLSTVKPEDPSVKGDNGVGSKPAKGCSVAGLNGVVQGLVVSQAAGADAHRSGTQVVSTPTLIPTKSSSNNNPDAQPEGNNARTDAASLMEKGDAVLNQNSVSNQSDTAPSTGGNNTQGAEGSWCFPSATAKSGKQVYHSVQEAWECGRQEIYDEATNFLSSGWRQAFEDGKKKDPEQIHVVPRPARM